MTKNAFRFVMAVNLVVLSFLAVVYLFRSSRFAEVEDWGLFLLFMLGWAPA